MRLIYMGTPDFAVLPLIALINAGHDVAAVFTQPDKPKGRGYALTPPPVKVAALERGIPVYQPQSVKDEETIELIRGLAPDAIVVAAYGKFLPEAVLNIPPYGCINIHASLLPKYRGAGPIQWCIINGETETGVTTMHMAKGMDTGDMILKKTVAIGPDETAGELHDRLSVLGAPLIVETLDLLRNGTAPRTPQNDGDSSRAPMVDKSLSPISFEKTADEIHNLVRGLNPWPVAHTVVDGRTVKVLRSKPLSGWSGKAGTLLDDRRFIVGCQGGTAIELLEVVPEGSKRMSGENYLLGKRLQKGAKIGL